MSMARHISGHPVGRGSGAADPHRQQHGDHHQHMVDATSEARRHVRPVSSARMAVSSAAGQSRRPARLPYTTVRRYSLSLLVCSTRVQHDAEHLVPSQALHRAQSRRRAASGCARITSSAPSTITLRRLASASNPSGAVSTMTQSNRSERSLRISRMRADVERAHRIGIRPSSRQQRQRIGDLETVELRLVRRLQTVVEADDVGHAGRRRAATAGAGRRR